MNAEIRDIPCSQLVSGLNDRKSFPERELRELADSIQTHGQVSPIVVRPLGEDRFEIVAGERRWRASKLARRETVTCRVLSLDDRAAAAVMLAENVHRSDLDRIDEGHAYQRRMEDFGLTAAQVAEEAHVHVTRVERHLKLLALDEPIQELVRHGDLPLAYALALCSLDHNRQHFAMRAFQGDKHPTIGQFRTVCGQLQLQQDQEAFEFEIQLTADEGPAPMPDSAVRRVGMGDDLPDLVVKRGVAATLAAYVRQCRDDQRPQAQIAADIVARLIDGLATGRIIRAAA